MCTNYHIVRNKQTKFRLTTKNVMTNDSREDGRKNDWRLMVASLFAKNTCALMSKKNKAIIIFSHQIGRNKIHGHVWNKDVVARDDSGRQKMHIICKKKISSHCFFFTHIRHTDMLMLAKEPARCKSSSSWPSVDGQRACHKWCVPAYYLIFKLYSFTWDICGPETHWQISRHYGLRCNRKCKIVVWLCKHTYSKSRSMQVIWWKFWLAWLTKQRKRCCDLPVPC